MVDLFGDLIGELANMIGDEIAKTVELDDEIDDIRKLDPNYPFHLWASNDRGSNEVMVSASYDAGRELLIAHADLLDH